MNFTASTMANLNRTTASRKDLWKSYRESIMESIIDSVSGRTLIIGYGNGKDMDIGEIISKSSEVTIMDIDIASAQNSIHEAWLEKVKFEQCDLNFFSLPENLPEIPGRGGFQRLRRGQRHRPGGDRGTAGRGHGPPDQGHFLPAQ